jgi:hypothetical protein
MTTRDLTAQERDLRDRLQGELVPPAVPDRLAYAIDRLAEDEMARASSGIWARLARSGASRWGRAVVALLAILAIAGGTLLLSSAVRQKVQVAATPIPTLPAVTQPSLPPGAANPTGIADGRWFDATSAYLLTSSGNIMQTTDGAQTWHQTGTLPSDSLGDATMLDASHGYALELDRTPTTLSLITLVTADGGAGWTQQPTVTASTPVYGDADTRLHFSDALHGSLLVTTWTPYPTDLPPNTPNVFCDAFGTNAQGSTCTVIPAMCTGFSTSDGGLSWARVDAAPCIGPGGARWWSPTLGSATSIDGHQSTTTDGGATWHTAVVPGVTGIKGFLAGPGVLVQVDPVTIRLAGVIVIDGEVVQPMTVWESQDDGASWRVAYTAPAPRVSNPPDANGSADFSQDASDLWAFDADHWLAIFSAGAYPSALLETWDAGRSWSNVGDPEIMASGSRWSDRLHGMLFGGPWTCDSSGCGATGGWLITNDGGQTWHKVPF